VWVVTVDHSTWGRSQPTTAAPRLKFETGLLLSSRLMGSIHDAPWAGVVIFLARFSTCQVRMFQAACSAGREFRVRVPWRSREFGLMLKFTRVTAGQIITQYLTIIFVVETIFLLFEQ